jgi:hypothetical protein
MDLLFKPGESREKYKQPKITYDFKNRMVKVRYERVTGSGTHSCSDNPSDHVDVLAFDELAVRL